MCVAARPVPLLRRRRAPHARSDRSSASAIPRARDRLPCHRTASERGPAQRQPQRGQRPTTACRARPHALHTGTNHANWAPRPNAHPRGRSSLDARPAVHVRVRCARLLTSSATGRTKCSRSSTRPARAPRPRAYAVVCRPRLPSGIVPSTAPRSVATTRANSELGCVPRREAACAHTCVARGAPRASIRPSVPVGVMTNGQRIPARSAALIKFRPLGKHKASNRAPIGIDGLCPQLGQGPPLATSQLCAGRRPPALATKFACHFVRWALLAPCSIRQKSPTGADGLRIAVYTCR